MEQTKNNKTVLIVMGIIFALIGFFMIKIDTTNKNRMDSKTYSTKIEYTMHKSHKDGRTTTMYSPIYYYSVDGIEYSCKTNFSSSSKPSNKPTLVRYMQNNPQDCYVSIAGKGFLNFLFLIFGIIAIFIGFTRKI